MSARSFFAEEARRRAAEVVKAVEAQSGSEIVIAVRQRSASYRGVSYLVGFLCSCGVLGWLVLAPKVYDVRATPLELLLAFGIGFLACSLLPPVQRVLTPARLRQAAVGSAARAAFFDLGISRTRSRSGILIFVSMLERSVEVLLDVGVDAAALGEGWTAGVGSLRQAVRRADIAGFLAALEKLGPVLSRAMPRAANDVNELPDGVR